MLIIHDGPDMPEFLKKKPKDKRITVMNTPTRFNDYGHSLRDIGLQKIQDDSYYTLLTNGDNYYVPAFIDEMCMFTEDLVYCNLVHNHWKYEAREAAMHRRGIDIGCAVVRTDIAKKVGFPRRDLWKVVPYGNLNGIKTLDSNFGAAVRQIKLYPAYLNSVLCSHLGYKRHGGVESA